MTDGTQALITRILDNIGRVMVGKRSEIELTLAALLARGHVLLEDVPGTGKTVLARSIAKTIGGAFSRIQFTPDLLPSDITGTRVFRPQTGEFVFEKGPVFANILLADEINRATPRTQSALLECMEESQVTDGGVTYPLERPFLVIATQNPVEIQGTFPLPEAQLDRFLVCLSLGYPSAQEAFDILSRFALDKPLDTLAPVTDRQAFIKAQDEAERVAVSPDVMRYIVSLCERTRSAENVALGASPRGMLCLMRASRALALVRGRDFVTPDDVKEMAVPVLAHRVILRGMYGKRQASKALILELLSQTPVPTEQA